MSALALALALAQLSAAQTPTAPPAASWPAGVIAKQRAELPFVVAALAIPVDQPPALLPLLASWLEQPESWPDGPVSSLLAAGGRLRAQAFADGLVVVAEGPAERQGEVVSAALALLSDVAPSARGFAPARAEALSERYAAVADDDARARRALWSSWYGEGAAAARAGPSERALLAATEADVRAALADVKARSSGHALFLEGAVSAAALPLVIGKLRPSFAPAGPPSLPRPAPVETRAPAEDRAPGAAGALVDDRPATSGAEEDGARVLVVGHPLPEGPWGALLGRAFTRALERRLEPLGDATVSVEAGRHARLLVVTLRRREAGLGNDNGTAASVRAAVENALLEAREQAASDRLLAADLAAAAGDLARAERRLGDWAERQARLHLTTPAELVPAATPPAQAQDQLNALVGLLRISVLPEVLRAAPPRAPREAATAPSAASGTGPG